MLKADDVITQYEMALKPHKMKQATKSTIVLLLSLSFSWLIKPFPDSVRILMAGLSGK